MSSNFWLMAAPLAMLGLLLLASVYRQIYLVGNRTAEQVMPLLCPLSAMGVHDLFSPVAENHLRRKLTPRQFRRAQRHRMFLALEYTRRISQNAIVLQQWARHELVRARALQMADCSRLSIELIAATVHCRMWALLLRVRVFSCLLIFTLLPFVSGPSFAALVRCGAVNLLDFYSKMHSAAGELGRFFEEGQETRLVELL